MKVRYLAQRFGIMSVPTMILFKKGQQAAAFSGYMPEAMLIKILKVNYRMTCHPIFFRGENVLYRIWK